MKFLKIEEHHEAQVWENNVFLTCGRLTQQRNGTTKNGVYVRLELPISLQREYFSAATFEKAVGKCRPCWLVTVRRPSYPTNPDAKYKPAGFFGWIPV